jgi:hypothetical protein
MAAGTKCRSGNERAAILFQPWMAPDGFGAPRRSRPTALAAENNHMKHFMNSVAIAAVLAIAVPALAQAQSSGPRPARPKAAHASTGHRHAGHASRAYHRGYTRTVRTEGAGTSPSDNVANQLNGQELQRLGTSSAPTGMVMPMAPASAAVPGGPRASGGGAFPAGPAGSVSATPGVPMEGPRVSGGGLIAAPTGPMPMPAPPPISSPAR